MRIRASVMAAAFALCGALSVTTVLAAEAWPTRSVRVIVPHPAGGSVDAVARIVTRKLADVLGKPFIVEGKGWACPYRLTAMGHDRVSLSGGADSVQAIQLAMDMVHNELSVMARHHKISFRGTSDFGFSRAAAPAAEGGTCPVMS